MNATPKRWARLLHWIRHHRVWVIVGIGVVLVLSASLVTLALLYQKPKQVPFKTILPKPKTVAPVAFYSPLTGEKVAAKSDETAPVTAVMIENSPDARPQSGLKQAGVVYEAIAEGGITRFMALYQQGAPAVIGPVRSVRQYDLEWMRPYDASLAHVGGSAQALSMVRDGSWRDLDQFFNAPSYTRVSDRYAPHNVYTSIDRLHALETAKGFTSSQFTGFDRTDPKPAKTPAATSIALNFSSALYNTTYSYDAATNTYPRSQAGAPHLDREEGQIAPSVVIALHVDEKTVLQDGYRQQVTTTGSGAATIFQNGMAIDATWHKADVKSQLSFTDKNNTEIPLVRGQTWIAAIPNDEGSISWQ